MEDEKKVKYPYGKALFEKIREGGFEYVDKTKFIKILEDTGDCITFLRPRRFGKSLFTSMLRCYYDVAYKDRFDELFGGLYIYMIFLRLIEIITMY